MLRYQIRIIPESASADLLVVVITESHRHVVSEMRVRRDMEGDWEQQDWEC